jgi:hypothetical protein
MQGKFKRGMHLREAMPTMRIVLCSSVTAEANRPSLSHDNRCKRLLCHGVPNGVHAYSKLFPRQTILRNSLICKDLRQIIADALMQFYALYAFSIYCGRIEFARSL